jgi:hypothetical protein
VGRVTLIDVVGNASLESGYQTAAILTRIVAVNTYSIVDSQRGQYLANLFYNVSTVYPRAWTTWMTQDKLAFPAGPTCIKPYAFPAPYTCRNPPPGVAVTVSASLAVQQLTLTTIVVQVSIS